MLAFARPDDERALRADQAGCAAPAAGLGAVAPASVTVTAQRSETGEVNLIGMRAPDALRRLEEFLDQAYLTNQSEVRVIHGVGSGALRKAVREYLSTSPYCTAFREAEPQAGGAGATIVEIGL
jgi:DNA mismatch repair protein MutS2